MNNTTIGDDLYNEDELLEVNELGNALMTEVLSEKLADHRKKTLNKFQNIGEINSYKTELDKLRSLRIANVHKILKLNEENDHTMQICAAEKLITKIEQLLTTHIKYSAKDVVSKMELEELLNQKNLLQKLNGYLCDIPCSAADSKLKNVEEFSRELSKIMEFIRSISSKLDESQVAILKDASDVLEF